MAGNIECFRSRAERRCCGAQASGSQADGYLRTGLPRPSGLRAHHCNIKTRDRLLSALCSQPMFIIDTQTLEAHTFAHAKLYKQTKPPY